MEYFIIVNPTAGGNNGRKTWPKIEKFLKTKSISYRAYFTEYDGHAVAIAMQILNQVTATNHPDAVLVAAGGDGTLHETLLGCMRFYTEHPQLNTPQVPIGLLPIGSGNDFARALNVPRHWQQALEELLACQIATKINIGHFINQDNQTDGYFLNNFGIGLDATVVYLANHSLVKHHQRFSGLAYWASVIHAVQTARPFKLTVTYPDGDTQIYPNAFLVTTTNHAYFGGGIDIAPHASVYKNTLDLIVVEKPTRRQIVLFVFMLLLKRHLHLRFVHHFSGVHFELKTNESRYGQIDGEELGSKTYDVSYETKTYPFWIKEIAATH